MLQTQKSQKIGIKFTKPTVQILTNDVQVLILCLSYFITTVLQKEFKKGPMIQKMDC